MLWESEPQPAAQLREIAVAVLVGFLPALQPLTLQDADFSSGHRECRAALPVELLLAAEPNPDETAFV